MLNAMQHGELSKKDSQTLMLRLRKHAWKLLVEEAQELTQGMELRPLTAAQRRMLFAHLYMGTNTGKAEHRRWITQHQEWLRENYNLLRAAWLYRWRYLWGEHERVHPEFRSRPCGEWYFAVLGEPPADCAADDWPLVLHQWYLQRMREVRREFERTHTPRGEVWQSGRESWKDWHNGVVRFGAEKVIEEWEKEAT